MGPAREAEFRSFETTVIKRIAGTEAVVSTGGGAVLDVANRRRMRDTGRVVWLRAGPMVLERRLETAGDRPSSAEIPIGPPDHPAARGAVTSLRGCGRLRDRHVSDVGGGSRHEDRAALDALIVAGRTELVVGRGLPDPILPARSDRERVALVTQPGATHIALDVGRQLQDAGPQVEVIGLPDREEAKTLVVAGSVYEALARFGLGRHDTIMGVGGGSVSDLAGFVAGTWLRGVEVVHVPTTLLPRWTPP